MEKASSANFLLFGLSKTKVACPWTEGAEYDHQILGIDREEESLPWQEVFS